MTGNRKNIFSNDGDLSDNPFGDIASELGFCNKKNSYQKGESCVRKNTGSNTGSERKTLDFGSFQKVVLQKSRKGRGGKTVTLVTVYPPLVGNPLQELCRTLKKQIGCGAWVEDGSVVLQGEVSERVAQFFEKKNVKKIVHGN